MAWSTRQRWLAACLPACLALGWRFLIEDGAPPPPTVAPTPTPSPSAAAAPAAPADDARTRLAELRASESELLAKLADASATDADLIALVRVPFLWITSDPAATTDPASEHRFERSETLARERLGNAYAAAMACHHRVQMILAQAANSPTPDTARERLEAAVAVASEGLDRYAEPPARAWLRLYRHQANRVLGRFAGLTGELEPAARDGQGDNALQALVWFERCRLYLDFGTPEQARQCYEDGRPFAAGSGDPGVLDRYAELEVAVELASANAHLIERIVQRHREQGRLRGHDALCRTWITRAKIQTLVARGRGDSAEIEANHRELEALLASASLPVFERSIMVLWAVGEWVERNRVDDAQRILDQVRGTAAGWTSERGALLRSDLMLLLAEARIVIARLENGADCEPAARLFLGRLEQAFEARAAQWDQAPILESGLGRLYFGEDQQLLRDLISLRRALAGADAAGATRASLDDILRAQRSSTLARRLGGVGGTWGDVTRDLLRQDQGLLLFLPAGYRSYVFAVDARSTLCVPIAGLRSEDLKHALSRLATALTVTAGLDRATFAHGQQASATAAARSVADLLLPEPIAQRLAGWQGVSVCGLDDITNLPLECLPIGNRPLGLTHAVRYLPSLPVALALAHRPTPPAPDRLAVLAAPTHSAAVRRQRPDLPQIPFEHADADRLGADAARTWLQAAATRDALLGIDAEVADVLLLLAHGTRAPADLRPARIILAPADDDDDGLLAARDIEAAHCPSIVLLASCSTALGSERTGDDGSQHIAGAFLFAGARSVVASPQALELDSTRRILDVLMPLLLQGEEPARAMLIARQALAADADFDHPALWGVWRVISP